MLSISKTKVCKEYIYTKKHSISLYSLEEIVQKFKKSKDKVSDITNFYLEKLNFDKLHFVSKLCSHSDGKTVFSANQIKEFLKNCREKTVDAQIIKELFFENTPEFSASLFEDALK
jgi:hypothetical protein